MNAQEAWDMGQQGYDPCDGHEHCEMCGVCETESGLMQERGPRRFFTDIPPVECLPCRIKAIAEDCP